MGDEELNDITMDSYIRKSPGKRFKSYTIGVIFTLIIIGCIFFIGTIGSDFFALLIFLLIISIPILILFRKKLLPSTSCSPSSSKNDIKNVLMDLARSTWLSVPTSSRPISSYPSPHRFMSRWNDVMAMDTASSSSLQKVTFSWPRPIVYCPCTPWTDYSKAGEGEDFEDIW